MADEKKKSRFAHDSATAFSASVAIDGSHAPIKTHADPRGVVRVDPHFGRDAVLSEADSRANRKAQKQAERDRRGR